jgi:hypothetical protein
MNSVSDPDSIGSDDPAPDSQSGAGSKYKQAKIGTQKGKDEEISCLKSQNVLCIGLRRHMTVFEPLPINFQIKFFLQIL